MRGCRSDTRDDGMMMNRRRRSPRALVVVILVLSAGGAWISGELVKRHDDIWRTETAGPGLFARICQATERVGFGCAEISQSGWAEIRLPLLVPTHDLSFTKRTLVVPVAFLGLAYFITMGVWFAMVGGPRPFGRRWHRLPLHLGRCGLLMSILYLGVMALGYASLCVWCCGVHAINFVMVLAIGRLCGGDGSDGITRTSESALPEDFARLTLTWQRAAQTIAVVLILVAGLWQYRRQHLAFKDEFDALRPYEQLVTSLRADPQFLMREYNAQPQHSALTAADSVDAADQVCLDVFTDFECPACYCNMKKVEDQIRGAFEGRITVRLRHYPLCHECNPALQSELHANACEAAYAAEAARLLGGGAAFDEMCALLFENRKHLGAPLYKNLAARLGLEVGQFTATLNGATVRLAVDADIALAEQLGVHGTPTMFLNGRKVPQLCQSPKFWETFAAGRRGSARASSRSQDDPAEVRDVVVLEE